MMPPALRGLLIGLAVGWIALEVWPLFGWVPVEVIDHRGRTQILPAQWTNAACRSSAEVFANSQAGMRDDMHMCCMLSGRRLQARCACSMQPKPDCTYLMAREPRP